MFGEFHRCIVVNKDWTRYIHADVYMNRAVNNQGECTVSCGCKCLCDALCIILHTISGHPLMD